MAGAHNIFEHSQDAQFLEFPYTRVALPDLFRLPIPEQWATTLGFPEPYFRFTKFMLIEVVAVVLLVAIFVPLARRAARETAPRGRLWNFFEAILVFVRDEVARRGIHGADADRFVPLLWTTFMFILFCNLLGMIPFAGSPTASLSVTGPLAVCMFATVLVSGMQKLGPLGYWKAQVPHMELPFVMALILNPLIFVLEVVGTAIRHGVLAVRLFANIFAGHTVLAVLLLFIVSAAEVGSGLTYLIAPASVLGVVALSLLERFIAFLQAYIFTFLAALFIGMALHPH